MLPSVIRHAASSKRFFNNKTNSNSNESSFTTLESLAESIEEALERRLYSINKSSRINLHDNNLFLQSTAIDPRYKLNFCPENLKNKVKRLLKSKVKNHSCRETCQSVEVYLVPPKNLKLNYLKIMYPPIFCRSITHLNRKQVQTLKKVSNMN